MEPEFSEQTILKNLMSHLPGMAYRCRNDPDWTMEFISEGCLALTGYHAVDLIHNRRCSYNDITYPDDRSSIRRQIETAIEQGLPYTLEYRIITQTGEQKWVWEQGQGVFDSTQTAIALEGFITDISQLKQTEEALRQAEAKYRGMFERAQEGIFQSTPDGQYLSINPALAKIYGYASPEAMMASLTNIQRQLYVDPRRRGEFIRLLQQQDYVRAFESQVFRQDGQVIWISENANAVRNDQGDLLYYEGRVEDISERKQTQDKLHQQAYYDALTGLPNRALFMWRLNEALTRSQSSNQQQANALNQFSLLFLDLDRFKVINDSLGHLVGDELLVAAAKRIQSCLRARDLVARLGGDEFTILLENLPDREQAIAAAQRIQKTLKTPFNIQGHKIYTSASIGITYYCATVKSQAREAEAINPATDTSPTHAIQEPLALLRDADTALYRAKAMGGGSYQVFNPRMHQKAVELLALETDLRQALNQQEFVLYYQPIISLADGRLKGFEALIRWHHPTRGLIAPDDFISIAEETGLIIPLGLWVLRTACTQALHWEQQASADVAPIASRLTISVNLSAKQFAQPELLEQIEEILTETGLACDRLQLEITENSWLKDETLLTSKIANLRQRDIQVCIDDFGTGYSSLTYLNQLPLNSIKIDRSFIHQLDNQTAQSEIARAIFMLAKTLGLETVAEGVETQQQLQCLQGLNCAYAQGFFFAKPLTAEASQTLIANAVKPLVPPNQATTLN